jgi:phage shock protein A
MAKARLAQTKAKVEFSEAREQFEQLQEQMDGQDTYGGADTSVANTLSAIEEAAIEAERLAGAILWRLKGPQAQELGASAPDCDNIESRLGAVHTKLQSINDDLRASADTLGA